MLLNSYIMQQQKLVQKKMVFVVVANADILTIVSYKFNWLFLQPPKFELLIFQYTGFT